MADLKTSFAGIESPNPFWLASGPPTNTYGQVAKAFDQGWGGAVWKTIGDPIINVFSPTATISKDHGWPADDFAKGDEELRNLLGMDRFEDGVVVLSWTLQMVGEAGASVVIAQICRMLRADTHHRQEILELARAGRMRTASMRRARTQTVVLPCASTSVSPPRSIVNTFPAESTTSHWNCTRGLAWCGGGQRRATWS